MARFTSAASFILDDIHITEGEGQKKEYKGILGGAGPYALYGTRIWLNANSSQSLAFAAHVGSDCPQHSLAHLESLGMSIKRHNHTYAHPYASNSFDFSVDRSETRGFEFLTSQHEYATYFRILPDHLATEWLQTLEYVHLCLSGDRCIKWAEGYRDRLTREDVTPVTGPPLIFWEPSPNCCVPSEYENFEKALDHVAVVSPNHQELSTLLGLPPSTESEINLQLLTQKIHPLTTRTTFIIRAGSRGCIVIPKRVSQSDALRVFHVPAYWTLADAGKVVDVTGAGNAFMGGLMAGFHCADTRSGERWLAAALYGSVSASFVVEQFGPPVLSADGEGVELWNGDSAERRLCILKERFARNLIGLC
ncbi:hypothetical protein HDU77_001896 [Chytriomyces hyalinus]|nr:hypothetical protein HDU77_001896 [Chytriomyces hyalinus]